MKRKMYIVADRLNGQDFEIIYNIMKDLYPRHKHLCYEIAKVDAREKRYKILWNMTPLESIVAEQIILKQIAPNATTYYL